MQQVRMQHTLQSFYNVLLNYNIENGVLPTWGYVVHFHYHQLSDYATYTIRPNHAHSLQGRQWLCTGSTEGTSWFRPAAIKSQTLRHKRGCANVRGVVGIAYSRAPHPQSPSVGHTWRSAHICTTLINKYTYTMYTYRFTYTYTTTRQIHVYKYTRVHVYTYINVNTHRPYN